MFLAGFVVVLAGVLAIGNCNRCNNKTEIELYDPNDRSKFECWPAPDCHEGQEPSVEPGSTHPIVGTDVHCKPCHEGVSYSNRETNYRCRKCTTCGKKFVLLTCTIFRDRLCDNRCNSAEFYLNATDNQCYPCTECCGHNDTNVELQCLLAKTVHIGSVIGEKGALHCKVRSSQQCDEQPKNNASSIVNNASVISDTSDLEKKCNGTKNNDSSNNISSSVLKEKCSWSWDTPHILLICGLVCMALIIVGQFWFYKKERKMRSSRSESCPCINSCYSSSAGHRCRGDCNMAHLLQVIPFQEKLKGIPEVQINRIPYEVEEHIKNLDAKKRLSKTWYDVGRKLGITEDVLNIIKREDNREDGSPTSALLSELGTWDNVISLRTFVQVLHDLKRNDIANAIIEFYKRQATTSDTDV